MSILAKPKVLSAAGCKASPLQGLPAARPARHKVEPPEAVVQKSFIEDFPPLSLYIHFPWCIRKCPYCDFNSHTLKSSLPEDVYIDALIGDLETSQPQIGNRPILSIFMGGGTPSLFSPQSMDRLLSAIQARFTLSPSIEVTMEANPSTFESEKFSGFRAAGINRLSIGIQSFNPVHLKALGRVHDDREAYTAIEIAHQYFDNFNLDLMVALPSQTLDEALTDIESALIANPSHISAYHLTLEPNTYFYHNPPVLPDDDLSADMLEAVASRLAAAGFDHYEVSAYAKPGRQAQHNLNYWMFGDYLGIGAGAHAKVTFQNRIIRQMRHKHPDRYLKSMAEGSALENETLVEQSSLPFEFMLNALRLTDGFAEGLFTERTGLPLAAISPQLERAEMEGLLVREAGWITPSERGRRYLNVLLQHFLET